MQTLSTVSPPAAPNPGAQSLDGLKTIQPLSGKQGWPVQPTGLVLGVYGWAGLVLTCASPGLLVRLAASGLSASQQKHWL